MAPAPRPLRTPEPAPEEPPPPRGSRSGTYAIVIPRLEKSDEEPFPLAWFEQLADEDD